MGCSSGCIWIQLGFRGTSAELVSSLLWVLDVDGVPLVIEASL
jgi:hypothetical protein